MFFSRSASGVRNAEMKWSNHERLDIYGVTLVGWPSDIPVQNPSSLKLNQNKQLLEALENGTMRFEKVAPSISTSNPHVTEPSPTDDMPPPPEDLETDSFSWAIQYEGNINGLSVCVKPFMCDVHANFRSAASRTNCFSKIVDFGLGFWTKTAETGQTRCGWGFVGYMSNLVAFIYYTISSLFFVRPISIARSRTETPF